MTQTAFRIALFAMVTIGAFPGFSPQTQAQSVEEQIRALQAQMEAMQAELQALRERQQQQAEEKKAEHLKVEAKGAPRFSGEGFKNFKIRGRLQADLGHVSDGDRLGAPALGTTTEIRRARLGVEGGFSEFKYKFEVDFSDNDVSVADAIISWPQDDWTLAIGHQKTPTSLEELTSSRFTSFMERAGFTDAFALERLVGVAAEFGGDNFGVAAGIYSDGGFSDDDSASGYALGGRAWFAPSFGDGFVHVGGSVLYRDNGAAPTRYRNRPLLHTTDIRFINADLRSAGVESDIVYGVEAGGAFGAFYVAAEYAMVDADLTASLSVGADDDYSGQGGYVHVGWFLTGEQRGYKDGHWDRTKPNKPVSEGGLGAFAVNLGFDYTDLNDLDASVIGGEQTGYLANLMWIPDAYVRFIAQYGHVDVDNRLLNGVPVDNVDTFGLRAQIDW